LIIKLRQKHFSVRKILVSPAKSIFTSTWLCQIHSFCRCLWVFCNGCSVGSLRPRYHNISRYKMSHCAAYCNFAGI